MRGGLQKLLYLNLHSDLMSLASLDIYTHVHTYPHPGIPLYTHFKIMENSFWKLMSRKNNILTSLLFLLPILINSIILFIPHLKLKNAPYTVYKLINITLFIVATKYRMCPSNGFLTMLQFLEVRSLFFLSSWQMQAFLKMD